MSDIEEFIEVRVRISVPVARDLPYEALVSFLGRDAARAVINALPDDDDEMAA